MLCIIYVVTIISIKQYILLFGSIPFIQHSYFAYDRHSWWFVWYHSDCWRVASHFPSCCYTV